MVVLLLALLVRPVVGSNLRLKNELIALAHVLGNRLSKTFERHEPERVYRLAGVALLILSSMVISDQTKLCIGGVAFDGGLGVFGEIADGGYGEAIHDYSLSDVMGDSRYPLVAWQAFCKSRSGTYIQLNARFAEKRSSRCGAGRHNADHARAQFANPVRSPRASGHSPSQGVWQLDSA